MFKWWSYPCFVRTLCALSIVCISTKWTFCEWKVIFNLKSCTIITKLQIIPYCFNSLNLCYCKKIVNISITTLLFFKLTYFWNETSCTFRFFRSTESHIVNNHIIKTSQQKAFSKHLQVPSMYWLQNIHTKSVKLNHRFNPVSIKCSTVNILVLSF